MSIRKIVSSLVVLSVPVFSYAAAVTTPNADITAIFGSGNPDTGWQEVTDTSADLVLGLRAKDHNTGATPNNGLGTYSFASGTVWNIEFSVDNTGASLLSPTYQYFLTINGLPFNLSLFPDNAYGTSSTANGQGTVGTFPANAAANNIMQNSERNTFPFIDDVADGTYTFDLEVEDSLGGLVDSDSINVQVGTPSSVPDSGAGIAGLGVICAVLWVGTKRSTGKLLRAAI